MQVMLELEARRWTDSRIESQWRRGERNRIYTLLLYLIFFLALLHSTVDQDLLVSVTIGVLFE